MLQGMIERRMHLWWYEIAVYLRIAIAIAMYELSIHSLSYNYIYTQSDNRHQPSAHNAHQQFIFAFNLPIN